MPRFRVMLRADSVVIVLEGKATEVGFFTTRAVDAGTADEAVAGAKALVRRDIRPSLVAAAAASLELHVEDVQAVPWTWRRFRRPAGFTFFLADSDARDADPR